MSIALITNYLPPYRLPLYELLHERYGVEVFCFGGEAHYVPEAQRDLERQLEEATFPAHRLTRQRDAAGLAESHDAVISALTGRVAVPAAYRGARRAGTPFILWASLWRHPLTLAHQFSFPMMRRIYRRADAIVTYGPHVSRYVIRHRKRKDGVFVAPQAVEPEIFGREVQAAEIADWRAQLGLDEDTPIVLFVGRLVREKGVHVLRRAWQRAGVGERAALCLVGDGAGAGGRRSDDLPGVHFAGRMDRELLPVAYAAAEMLVVPSISTRRFLEPWGLVCNEAMSQGTPVIASTAVGAVPGGLVHHGATGMVVAPEDDRELAGAIVQLLEDRPLRERLGRMAQAAIGDYSYDHAAESFGQALRAAGARTRV